MSTNDFALPPNTNPSRQGQVQLRASEIVRLGSQADVDDLLSSPPSKGYRVAAVLPKQELSAWALEALEDAGVLVVKVPSNLSEASIAAFLTAQLNEGASATAARMDAIDTSAPAAAVYGHDELHLSDEEEAEFLDAINHPVNQLGCHF